MHYDYIIIGSGLAGLNFALNASKKGRVLIVTKAKIADGSTWLAQGGIAAVFDTKDSFAKHIKNTLEAGAFHNDRKAVEYIIRRAPAAIRKLQQLGVDFDAGNKGKPALNLEGGHSARRIVHCGDHTGKSIEEVLVRLVRACENISIMEKTFVKDLLVKKGKCHGVQVIKGNRIRNIFGGCIALATGGLGQVYARTTNPPVSTGDGVAIAQRAGCRMKDLEFIQFHPTALKRERSPYFLISETLRGHGARLVNGSGIELMKILHPLKDLAPRDIISRTVFKEEKLGPVYLDAREISKTDFKRNFPSISQKLLECGIDHTRDLIPVTAVSHYSCGGIVTDLKGRTNVKNLYAFGEVACTGLHGANRLASNSLLEAVVLTENVPPATGVKTDIPAFDNLYCKKQKSSLQIRKQIRKIMWTKVGIVRSKSGLRRALEELGKIGKKLPPATDRETAVSANMLTTAILIAGSALKRKKSLGCHFIT